MRAGAGAVHRIPGIVPPMDEGIPEDEVIRDLLRSAWIIESARAEVYARWAEQSDHSSFAASRERAAARAAIVEASLTGRSFRT
ncbi:MAG: hypothetical protein ACRDF6_09370, partial [bacterium]